MTARKKERKVETNVQNFAALCEGHECNNYDCHRNYYMECIHLWCHIPSSEQKTLLNIKTPT
jgi:hypothetical protein